MRNYIRVSFFPKSEILLGYILLQDLGQLREVGCQYRIKCQSRSISFRFQQPVSHPVEIQQETC